MAMVAEDHVPLTTEDELMTHFKDAGYEKQSNPSNWDVFKEDMGQIGRYFSGKYSGAKRSATSVRSGADVAKLVAAPFPVVGTTKDYKRGYAIFDIPAGLVEGVMKVPMGLAYAQLANMPVEYGLYTGLMPPFLYMIFGTCHQLSMGVAAIECVLVADSVRGVIGNEIADSEEAIDINYVVQYTLFFSLVAGLWQLLFRFLNLQFLSALLSDPVISGFATGGAIIVMTTQLSGALGIKLPTEELLPDLWVIALKSFDEWNWTAVGLCLCSMAFLFFFQFINKKYFPQWPVPWQVPLVIFTTLISYEMKLNAKYDLPIVGEIPAGLPATSFPSMPTIPGISSLFAKTLLPAFIIGLFTYVISLSLAKVFARKNGYSVESGQELFAIGMLNTISSSFGAFVVSASFSRTAVVHAIGAKTVFHNATAVAVMMLVLSTITGLLHDLPKCVLSAVVLNGIWFVPEWDEMMRYYRLNKSEFLIWQVTFWVCITGGAIWGIASGVGASLLYIMVRYTTSKTVRLGRLPGTVVYRNVLRFPMAEETEGLRIVRFDGNLNFANQEQFVNGLMAATQAPSIHAVVVDASSINDIDSSSMRGLVDLVEDFEARGVLLYFADWKGPQRDMLERSDFYLKIKRETMFLTLHDAVVFAHARGAARKGEALIAAKQPHDTVVEVAPDGHQHAWAVAYPDEEAAGQPEEAKKDPETTAH